jgi:hypothetical protein
MQRAEAERTADHVAGGPFRQWDWGTSPHHQGVRYSMDEIIINWPVGRIVHGHSRTRPRVIRVGERITVELGYLNHNTGISDPWLDALPNLDPVRISDAELSRRQELLRQHYGYYDRMGGVVQEIRQQPWRYSGSLVVLICQCDDGVTRELKFGSPVPPY